MGRKILPMQRLPHVIPRGRIVSRILMREE
ncbi:putative protein OS=Leifsonia shinshuensis OX=150026 GN=HNR13_002069 PE=4 SV=1 [Leifsonia shinshuensis]|jgi:hypothetical protein|uniref:Uncharacterized protein n=1 Tax=Leifsonia shinshuensis TaxID=150026 RepID=A0A853CTS1_9MICO|nr:hypothetical protein [Leifsonia shinshuensis]